jgi:hypothetical protein
VQPVASRYIDCATATLYTPTNIPTKTKNIYLCVLEWNFHRCNAISVSTNTYRNYDARSVGVAVCHEVRKGVILLYRVYFVSIHNILIWVCKVQYNVKRDGWECFVYVIFGRLMLKVGFDVSLDKLYAWERVRDKTRNYFSTWPYITCLDNSSLNRDRMLHWNIWYESNLYISEARLVIVLHSECPSE